MIVVTQQEFDYVIVGGGSAGCCVAGRLSEDLNTSVCLLEAGGPDNSVFVKAPLGFAATASLNINSWGYETVPQAGFNGRKGFQPRGKVMGGSSSVNAMVYTRVTMTIGLHLAMKAGPTKRCCPISKNRSTTSALVRMLIAASMGQSM